jgi:protein-S-isoprenylcysteine O-methyltransferase Ste14
MHEDREGGRNVRLAVAIVLEVVFAVLAFGVRSWIQLRRTGSTGFVRPRWGAPAVEQLAAVLFVGALVLLVAAPAADAAGTARWSVLDHPAPAVAGAVLAAAGIAVCIAAQLTMGDSWRIGVDSSERTALVTTGVFGRVRNPIFSAMVVAGAGIALLLPNWWALAGLVALVGGLELQVRYVEEPYLGRVHGAAYREYAARTGRFVPGVGVIPASPA